MYKEMDSVIVVIDFCFQCGVWVYVYWEKDLLIKNCLVSISESDKKSSLPIKLFLQEHDIHHL